MRSRTGNGTLAELLILSVCLCILTACSPGPPEITITSPENGLFTTDTSVLVQGVVLNVDPESIADVTVGGVSVMPLVGGIGFSISVPLAPGQLVQPIVAELTSIGGPILRDRITVISGDFSLDGEYATEGVALRMSEAGLDAIEGLVTSLVDLDLASLLPAGHARDRQLLLSGLHLQACLGPGRREDSRQSTAAYRLVRHRHRSAGELRRGRYPSPGPGADRTRGRRQRHRFHVLHRHPREHDERPWRLSARAPRHRAVRDRRHAARRCLRDLRRLR